MWVAGKLWNGKDTDSSPQELPQDPGSASRVLVLQENWAEFGVLSGQWHKAGRWPLAGVNADPLGLICLQLVQILHRIKPKSFGEEQRRGYESTQG